MSVQYKTSDGWKNISSSSNNAVDVVADGNMNPVTSNAVYDALFKSITITNQTFTIPLGGYVGWQSLTGLTTQPRLALLRLTSVSLDGADGDCFVEIKSSKYGVHAVFTNVASGLPLDAGRVLTISGIVYYI